MKSSDHFIKLDKSHPKLINTNDNSKTNDTGNYGFDPNNLITKKVDDDQSNQRSQSLLKQESLSIQEPAEKYREHRRRFKSLYQLQKRKSIENELLRSISNYQSYPKEKIDPSDVNSASVTPSNSGAQLNFQNLQIMHQRVKSGTIFKQNVHQNNKSQISLGSIQRKSTIVFHDEENYQKVVSFPQSLKNSEIQRNSSCESPNKNQQEVIGNYNQDEKINTFQNVQPFSGQFDMKQLSIDLKQLKHIQNQQDYQIHSQGGVDGFYYGNQFVDQILEEDDDEGKPEVHIVDPLNITHDSGESSPDGMKHLEFINVQENESQNHEQLVSFVNYEDTQDENKARDSYQIEVHQPKIDYYQNNSIENLQQYAQERYFTKQFNQEFSQVNINNKVKKVPFLTQLATERIGQKPPMFQSKSYKLKSNRVKPISNNNFKSNHSGLDSAQSRERSYFLVQQQLQNAKIISKENEKSQNYITPQGECTDYLILLSNFLRNSYQRKSFQIKAFLSYSNDANQTISQSHDIFNKNHNKILVIKLWNIIKEDKQILERVDLIEKILFIIQQKLNQQIINTKIYIEDVLDYIYSDQKQILNSQKNGSKFYHKYLNRDQLPSVQTICKICNKNTDFKDIENFKAFNDKNSSQQIQVSNINGRLLISNKKMIDLQEDLLHCQSLQQNQQKLQLQQQAYNNLLNMQITPEYLNENVKQESIERNLMMSSRPDIVDEEAISKCTFGPQNTDQDDDQRGSVQIKNYKTQQMTSQILNLKNKIPENSKVVRREISLYSGGASRSGDIFSVRSPQFLLNSQFGVNTQNFNAQRNNNHNTIHLHESSASASLIESAIITNRSQLIFKSGQNLKSAGSRDFYLRNYLNSNQIPLKNEVLKSQSNMIHSIVFDENEVCEICGETIEKHDLDINFELHYQIEQYQEMLVNTTYNQNSTLIQNAMTRHSKKHSLIKQDDDKNQIKFQINNETGAGLLRTKTPVDIEQQEQIDFIGQNDNIQKEDGPSIKQLSKAKETLTQKLYNKLFQSSGAGNENTLISQAHTLKNNQENRLSSLEFQTCYGLNNFKSVVQFSKNRSFIQNQQSQRQIGTLQSILKKKNNGPGHFKQMSVGEQEGLQHRLDLARFNIMNGLGIISKQNSAVQVFQPTELQNKNMKFIQSKFIDSTQNIPEETHVICIICAEQFEKSLWKQIKMKCENQSVKHLICSNCNIHCIEEQIKQFRKELICPQPGCLNQIQVKQISDIIPKSLVELYSKSLVNQKQETFCNKCYSTSVRIYLQSQICDDCGQTQCNLCGFEDHPYLACDKKIEQQYSEIAGIKSGLKKLNYQICVKCDRVLKRQQFCKHFACHSCQISFCIYCRQSYDKNHLNPFSSSPCKIFQISNSQLKSQRKSVSLSKRWTKSTYMLAILGILLWLIFGILVSPIIYTNLSIQKCRTYSNKFQIVDQEDGSKQIQSQTLFQSYYHLRLQKSQKSTFKYQIWQLIIRLIYLLLFPLGMLAYYFIILISIITYIIRQRNCISSEQSTFSQYKIQNTEEVLINNKHYDDKQNFDLNQSMDDNLKTHQKNLTTNGNFLQNNFISEV